MMMGPRQGKALFPFRFDLHGAFIRRVDLSGANLTGANLSNADAKNATFRGADFKGADLEGAVLIGADLSDAVNLTVGQLSKAVLDATTTLPAYIDRNVLMGSAAE